MAGSEAKRYRVGGYMMILLKNNRRMFHERYILYIDRINVNILVVALNYSFARCIIGRNWVKGTWALLFLIILTESAIISKSEFNLKSSVAIWWFSVIWQGQNFHRISYIVY